jgi:hypothetical protein
VIPTAEARLDAALAYRLASSDDLETTAAAVRRRAPRLRTGRGRDLAERLTALAAGIEHEFRGSTW